MTGPRIRSAGDRPVVYVVDDDHAVRSATCMLLIASGFRARSFASAEEYFDTADREEASCLVLDLQMPGLSGADLIEMSRRLGVDTPTIVVTAFADHPLADRARAAGAIDVISKPFRDEELLEAIGRAVEAQN